jgi:hypothetical protein
MHSGAVMVDLGNTSVSPGSSERFQSASPDVILWRYMSFEKFIDFILTKSFYFSRLDKFSDPFEGMPTKKEFDRRKDAGLLRFLINSHIESHKTPNKNDINREIIALFKHYKDARESTIVNCWHMSDYESEAMWKIYGDQKNSVCIKTTVEELCRNFNREDTRVAHLKVEYIDFSSDARRSAHLLEQYKRKSFEHEKEYRFFIQDYNDKKFLHDVTEFGAKVKVESLSFINEIFVSPLSDSWFLNCVVESVKAILPESNFKITRSEIYDRAYLKEFLDKTI